MIADPYAWHEVLNRLRAAERLPNLAQARHGSVSHNSLLLLREALQQWHECGRVRWAPYQGHHVAHLLSECYQQLILLRRGFEQVR